MTEREKIAEIRAFLAKETRVQIYIEHAGGVGHQANAVAIAERLRQVGYEGQIELVYYENSGLDERARKMSRPTLRDKLHRLLPEFDPRGFESQNVRGFLIRRESEAATNPANIVVSGGDTHPPFGRHRLRIRPWAWGPAPSVLGMRTAKRPVADPARDFTRLFQGIEQGELKQKVLLKILERVAARRMELQAFYGFPNHSTRPLQQLVRAHKMAQNQHNVTTRGPIVIPLFRKLGKVDVARRADLQFPLFTIFDPKLFDKIRAAGRGQVVVVEIGPVPQTVYRHMNMRSTYPPIGSGKNSLNLLLNLGRPFLPMFGQTSLAGQLERLDSGTSPQLLELVRDAQNDLGNFWLHKREPAQLAKFIALARKRNSALRWAFRRASKEHRKRDKIIESLYFFTQRVTHRRRLEGNVCDR